MSVAKKEPVLLFPALLLMAALVALASPLDAAAISPDASAGPPSRRLSAINAGKTIAEHPERLALPFLWAPDVVGGIGQGTYQAGQGVGGVVGGAMSNDRALIDQGLLQYGEIAGPFLVASGLTVGKTGASNMAGADFAVGTGRLGGLRYGRSRMDRLVARLKKQGVEVQFNSEWLKQHNARGAFMAGEGSAKMILRKNPTVYEVWHEYQHFRDWRSRAGKSVREYRLKSKALREQFVYDQLRRPGIWNKLNRAERIHASIDIDAVGGDPLRCLK